MDAYLICPETKKSLWLGKPIRQTAEDGAIRVQYYHCGPADGSLNHEDPEINKLLWKFLADHARKDLRIVFSGDFDEEAYEMIVPWDVEAREYLRGWPPQDEALVL